MVQLVTMLKAVIFDLDGTLTDFDVGSAKKIVSEELAALTGESYKIVREKLEHVHYTFNIQGVYDRNIWWEQFNPELPLKEKQRLTNVYWDRVIETTCVKPYADTLLRTLKQKGLLLVLLTDHDGESFSKKERVDILPIVAYFDLIVISGDDTKETKPSPEPFLYILEQLQVTPEEVLMVGDKPEVDLQGAYDLGMKTLLLKGDYGSHWKDAVSDLQGVLVYIEGLLTTSA